MITGMQIFGVLFGLFMLYITFLQHKRNEFTSKEWIFWSILWSAFVFVSIYPLSLEFIVRDIFKMERPLDFLIITGFIFMIGFLYYTYIIVRKNQKKIDSLVRKLAMEEKK